MLPRIRIGKHAVPDCLKAGAGSNEQQTPCIPSVLFQYSKGRQRQKLNAFFKESNTLLNTSLFKMESSREEPA